MKDMPLKLIAAALFAIGFLLAAGFYFGRGLKPSSVPEIVTDTRVIIEGDVGPEAQARMRETEDAIEVQIEVLNEAGFIGDTTLQIGDAVVEINRTEDEIRVEVEMKE